MTIKIFLEGGGDSKDLRVKCREAFAKWLAHIPVKRMPRLVACGGREAAFDSFRNNCGAKDQVAVLWVDSEEPPADLAQGWLHLKERDLWSKPKQAKEDILVLMVTCTETWLLADRPTLERVYGKQLQQSALLSLFEIESKPRHEVFASLEKATKGSWAKGIPTFKLLSQSDPHESARHCESAKLAIEKLENICRKA